MNWWDDDLYIPKQNNLSLKSLALRELVSDEKDLHSVIQKIERDPAMLNCSLECEEFWPAACRISNRRMSFETNNPLLSVTEIRKDLKIPRHWYEHAKKLDEGIIWSLGLIYKDTPNDNYYDKKVVSQHGAVRSIEDESNRLLKFYIPGIRPATGVKGRLVHIQITDDKSKTEERIGVIVGENEETENDIDMIRMACELVREKLKSVMDECILVESDGFKCNFSKFPSVEDLMSIMRDPVNQCWWFEDASEGKEDILISVCFWFVEIEF